MESTKPIVAYAHIGFPDSVWGRSSVAYGGSLKYRYLDKSFPHAGLACNILYVVSNGQPFASNALLKRARHLGIHVVWNQNGAFFPSAYGVHAARQGNKLMAKNLGLASYVFYQSKFAKMGSDHFLGPCPCPFEILYNAVDTSVLVPKRSQNRDGLTLLVCGSHNDSYRLPLALDVFEILAARSPCYRMMIAGRMSEIMEIKIKRRIEKAGLLGKIKLSGEYSQDQAPGIYQSADLLLHTQYNDVCPSVVLEAMACGLPIVYSKTGGTPELVGDAAGCGVPSELNWDMANPPDAYALADSVIFLSGRIKEASHAARQRAIEKFSLSNWIDHHNTLFLRLLGKCDD